MNIAHTFFNVELTKPEIRVWLVQGFDTRDCKQFLPDPCLFRTEEQAIAYCEYHSNRSVVYGYGPVGFGVFEHNPKKKRSRTKDR